MTKLALAQLNPTVGDIEGNSAKILAAYKTAKAKKADLLITPELSLIGYTPQDRLLMLSFQQQAMEAIHDLATKTKGGPAMVVGSLWQENGKLYNAAIFLDEGKIAHVQTKTTLPNYGVFDEKRWFTPGQGPNVFKWRGHTLGFMICEDVWNPDLAPKFKAGLADLIIVINASPFEVGKLAQRHQVAASAAKAADAPLIYLNQICGQDDIIFDGGSFAMNATGDLTHQLPQFQETTDIIDLSSPTLTPQPSPPILETFWKAMKLGLHDYVTKNGFKGVLLGLSGGIDSAITAALAVDALGKDKVRGVLLPSPYTSKESTEDALETGRLLGIHTDTIAITPSMQTAEEVLNPVFKDAGWMTNPALGGNLQARLRGLMLMALSNKSGFMLLSTGNKSEIAVGYSTLYGDSCGGYNVLKDLYKMQIFDLANWRNRLSRVIPERSITKPPSAELAPGQKDEDQLPPYVILDAILALHLEGRLSAEEIIAEGYSAETVHKVVRLVKINEYKRRQSCPGVKLSPMLFGIDRRFALTDKG